MRLALFTENVKKIEQMNANPDDEAVYGINNFADWTHEEFMKLNSLIPLSEAEKAALPKAESPKSYNAPANVDHNGNMNSIKDQGSCGSCWAFAANGAHEVTWNMNKGRNFDLSEQQLVDCSRGYRNQGCNGGWYFWAWDYVKSFGGLNAQSSYKYTARDQACSANSGDKNAPIQRYRQISATSDAVKEAIYLRPVAVAVDASNWSSYSSGIFSNCGTSINHAVVAVGYTPDYWIIRNSWGQRWGESGKMKLKMGNTCGVLNYVYQLDV